MHSGRQNNFLEERLDSLEPLVTANDRNNFIKHAGFQEPPKLLGKRFLKSCPLGVIDRETLKIIQVLRLHQAVDFTMSTTGSAVLLRSLARPETDLEFIKSKQESVKEIASNDRLRQALSGLVHEFSQGESPLYKLFNKGLNASFPYLDIKRVKSSLVDIFKAFNAVPKPETLYLNTLISRIDIFKGSSINRMMNGIIYKTFQGLKSDAEVGFFTPKIKFIPRRFTKWILAGPAVALAPIALNKLGSGFSISPALSTIGLVWTAIYVFYCLFIKPVRDTEFFIEPLRKAFVSDPAFGRAVDALGMIDELLSFHKFASESHHSTILPEITDGSRHYFEAQGLRSPVLAKDNPDFVPNDVRLNEERLTFITGPNSGGKTTICKSIVHNQLLAQIGSYLPAEKAFLNIADIIRYQAPAFDGLEDEEGRFGTELARTRDIFFSTSPRSLVVFDEMAEGTTFEETLRESYGILSDFHTIGNNTLLVTHNHSLVDRLLNERKGQGLMVEFNGDDPTYRLAPGVSRASHADKIARRIGFSGDDRRRYMKDKGYA